MKHSVWEEFFKAYDRKEPSGTDFGVLFFGFLEDEYRTLLEEERADFSTKTRVSLPRNMKFGVHPNSVDEIRKAAIFAERVVLTSAPPITCQAYPYSRFANFTCDSWMWSPMVKDDGGVPVSLGLGSPFHDHEEWVLQARSMLLSGRLNYLPHLVPRSGPRSDEEDVQSSMDGQSWSSKLLELPGTSGSVDDAQRWQSTMIARDFAVSDRIHARHLLPEGLNLPLQLSWKNSSVEGVSLALGKLSIPEMKELSLEQLNAVIEEERSSFLGLVNSIDEAVKELGEKHFETEDELNFYVRRIQTQKIDSEIDRINQKIRRLERYQTLRLGGYATATTGLLALAVTMPTMTAAASGAMGGITLIKLFDSVVNVLEKRRGAIRDDSQSFLGRIAIE